MRKVLFPLISILLWQSVAFAQPQKPILHLQSLYQSFVFPINDSIVFTGGKANVSTNSQAFLTRFNIRKKTWNHILECPDSLTSFRPLLLMENNLDGYYLGPNGRVYKTANNLTEIRRIRIPFTTTQVQGFNNLFKTNSGYLIQYSFNNQFYYYFSADGESWTFSGQVLNGNISIFGDTIFYGGFNKPYFTTNGGATMPSLISNEYPGTTFPASTTRWKFITKNLVFAGNINGIQRSTDGGQTWNEVVFPTLVNIGAQVFNFYFKNALEGVIVTGVNDPLFYTTNGGNTILQMPGTEESQQFVVHFIGNTLLRGQGSLFGYLTNNWGQTYDKLQSVTPLSSINDISFHNNIGLIVGERGRNMISTNGGHYFHEFIRTSTQNNSSANLQACAVVNDTVMLVGDFGGGIYRSVDKGRTWSTVNSGSIGQIIRFKWNNRGEVLAIGANNISLSTNHGRSFTRFPSGTNATRLMGLRKNSSAAVYAREFNADLFTASVDLQTVASSNTFTPLATIQRGNFRAVDVNLSDDNHIHIIGSDSDEKLVLYKSADGGSSYQRQSGLNLPGLSMAQTGLKWTAFTANELAFYQNRFNMNDTSYNRYYYTNNGGQNWQNNRVQIPFGAPTTVLRSAHFFDSEKFWVGSGNAMLLFNTFADGSVSTFVHKKTRNTNSEAILFPNPTSGQLQIGGLMNGVPHVVQIFDLSGSLVFTDKAYTNHRILNTKLKQGMYLVRVEAPGGLPAIHKLLVK